MKKTILAVLSLVLVFSLIGCAQSKADDKTNNTVTDNTAKNTAPQDNAPQNNTPQNNTPQNNTPQNNTPQDNTPKFDKGDIKEFRKALIQWCKENYTYDEAFVKSNPQNNEKYLKEFYETQMFLSEYGFNITPSKHLNYTQKERQFLATSVVCKNEKTDGEAPTIYFKDAFVFKVGTDEERQFLTDSQKYIQEHNDEYRLNTEYFDGEYFYCVGETNSKKNFQEFLKKYRSTV